MNRNIYVIIYAFECEVKLLHYFVFTFIYLLSNSFSVKVLMRQSRERVVYCLQVDNLSTI